MFKIEIMIQKTAIIENGANGVYFDYFSVANGKWKLFKLKLYTGRIYFENNRIQRNQKSGVAIRGFGSA